MALGDASRTQRGARHRVSGPRLAPLAAALPASVPFVGPEALERQRGMRFRARLGANESAFGPSPRAVAAMATAARDAWMYGDPEAHDLRAAIAARHRVAPRHVAVGEGIDGLLGHVVRLILAPGETAVMADGAYPTFAYHVTGHGGRILRVPYSDDAEDIGALLDAARTTGARLVYLANPDNPMGSWHTSVAVEEMVEALPDGVLLILDEAYVEFAPEGTAPRVAPDDPRVIRLRTFSKAHGLAGLRVGYALGAAPLIGAFDRVRNHFGVGRIAQAGALAALGDTGWLGEVVARTAAARARLGDIAADHGLRALPSATNFVALDCGGDAAFAAAVLAGLLERGIFARKPFAAPGDRCIRIGCGTDADLDRFAEALGPALGTR